MPWSCRSGCLVLNQIRQKLLTFSIYVYAPLLGGSAGELTTLRDPLARKGERRSRGNVRESLDDAPIVINTCDHIFDNKLKRQHNYTQKMKVKT